MGRDRWMAIENALHPDIAFLMDELRKRSKKYYNPTTQLSIDETLFLYKGRVRFRQRMPLKPQSTGLKYFVMADALGFIVDAFLYKGKETVELRGNENIEQKTARTQGQTCSIVEYFISRLKTKGHVLFMDKYYGGLEVMDALLAAEQNGVLACQGNRPTNLFNQGLASGIVDNNGNYPAFEESKSGEWDWAYRTNGKLICAISFNDKKVCNFLSNVDNHHGYTK